jgi:hypothetical protein
MLEAVQIPPAVWAQAQALTDQRKAQGRAAEAAQVAGRAPMYDPKAPHRLQ